MKSLPATIAAGVLVLCVIIAGWTAIMPCGIIIGILYITQLSIKALKTYLKSSKVREEKKVSKRALGEVIKNIGLIIK